MKEVNCGHYSDIPLVTGPGTMIIPRGMSLNDLYIIETEDDKLPFTHIVVEEGARADIVVAVMPGISVSLPVTIDFAGISSECNISGFYMCGSDEKITFDLCVHHRFENCVSNQLFNGIAAGRSKISFSGKIIVAPGAVKTEAYQINRNIILSGEAKVDTKPQLEIYADDVKCSHGATMGGMDENELFYMRSRGIPGKEAKILQAKSFLYPVLSHIEDQKLRSDLEQKIDKQIRDIL